MLEQALLKTIVYYDCFDYPLTSEELSFFLFNDRENGSPEINSCISSLINKNIVIESNGFYFLKGNKNLIEIRKERNELAKKKWQKALKAAGWLQTVPYVRAIFASGSLALNNTPEESDLDFLAVTKAGRIWTARSLAVFLLNFLGLLRRRGQITAPDKVCLNHVITDKSLYIPRKSIYTAQLYVRLIPIMGDEKLVNEFCKANSWVGDYVVGWPECLLASSKKRMADNKFLGFIRKTGEKILDTKLGDLVETIFRKYNVRRIKNYYLTYKSGGRVKADDESLEFHPDSPELRIIERYNRTMIKLEFPELAKEADSGLMP